MRKEKNFDVAVIGAGAMGSAVLYHLAKRGVKACGIEQFGIAHDRGSSHGDTRIIRKAYFEHPDYVPLLNRSYELWNELAEECGEKLMVNNGLIVAGEPDSETIISLRRCYRKYEISHECWTANETIDHFPQFRIPHNYEVFYDPFGGFLFVEKCVEQHLKLAQNAGAILFTDEQVVDWQRESNGFHINTSARILFADKLIFTMGAWSKRILEHIGISMEIWRKEVYWHGGKSMSDCQPDRFPVYYIERDYGHFYGFPTINEKGLKVAEHEKSNIIAFPEQLDNEIEPKDEQIIMRFLSDCLPGVEQRRNHFSLCMYSKTPDNNFILDVHPENSNIIIGAGFSGHGFKFSPVVGEILTDFALDGRTRHPIDFFRIKRFLNH